MFHPAYIIFDGADGAGKTSIIAALKEFWQRQKRPVAFAAFPSHSRLGAHVRMGWEGEYPPKAWPFLHLAEQVDREQATVDHLRDGRSVILDRHAFTSGPAYAPEFYSVAMRSLLQQSLRLLQPNIIFHVIADNVTMTTRVGMREDGGTDVLERGVTPNIMTERSARIGQAAVEWVGHDRVVRLTNDGTLHDAVTKVLHHIKDQGHTV